ncbi:MAG: hypothetical protein RDV48_25655 [Candidatus Eremiobacteraeota bacterium]|nr:hypothetical protein [Candidatus Eremiobacteraeota bacterium]
MLETGSPEGYYLLKDVTLRLRPVYYGAPLEGTAIGKVVLDADLALKSLHSGFDYRNGKALFLSPKHKQLVIDCVRAHPETSGSFERCWLCLDRADISEDSGRLLIEVKMKARVVAQKMRKGEIIDDAEHTRKESEALADYLSGHLEEAKKHFPALGDLEELYRILVLLEVLKAKGITLPDDPSIHLRTYESPETVKGNVAAYIYSDSAYLWCLPDLGGVDLSVSGSIHRTGAGNRTSSDKVSRLFQIKY